MPVLTNDIHERYARLRSLLMPANAAAKSVGLSPRNGAVTKLEQNKQIQARVAEFSALDEEIIREKRTQIEAGLSAIAYGDGSQFMGKKSAPKWPDRLNAFNQLRDLHGFKAPSKTAFTDPSGQNGVTPFVVEIVKFSDAKPADKAPA